MGLNGVDEGRQQQLAIAQQHRIEKRSQGLRVGGEHRPAPKHDRIAVAPFAGPQRDPLLLEQIQ